MPPRGHNEGVTSDSLAAPETGPSLVFERALTQHSVLEDVLGILSGTFTASLGLHLLHEAHAVTGGTAGLSLLLGYATHWPFWLLFLVINLPFAVLAVWKKGWNFTLRTCLSIGLVSWFSVVHQAFLPMPNLNPVYGTIGGNLLAGIGLLILFRHHSSLGGISIIALIVQDSTGFRAGWTQMAFDIAIVTLSLLVVPWNIVLLSAGGAIILNLVLALNHRPGRYIGH